MLRNVTRVEEGRENLEWLVAQQRFGVHPGLMRVRALLSALGEPQRQFRVILVGGTNGKGSTAASLEAMLRSAGQCTGLFTSPHLTRLSERFVVSGQALPEEVVLSALGRVRPHAETQQATFFEIVTALGCLLFAEAGVERAVMEVGLGGRLDATNALEPELSLITNVTLDHTAVLGDTPEAIAQEKAGILRPDKPAVTTIDPALWPVLEARGANLWALGREWSLKTTSLGWEGQGIRVATPQGELELRSPLLGEHGALNAALAAVAALRLGLETEAIGRGAALTRWPGRLEVLRQGTRRLVLDGAHNPAGAQALRQALLPLLRAEGRKDLPIIFGAAEDKDVAGVVSELRPLASRVILTRAALSPRAAAPGTLAPHFGPLPLTLTQTPAQALAALQDSEDLVLVCGSLYLLGEVRPALLGESLENYERWQ